MKEKKEPTLWVKMMRIWVAIYSGLFLLLLMIWLVTGASYDYLVEEAWFTMKGFIMMVGITAVICGLERKWK